MKKSENNKILLEHNFPVIMRDGISLAANIFRLESDKKYPAIIIRTPYSKDILGLGHFCEPIRIVNNGYVLIVQDVRGRYCSEGVFEPFVNEMKDGFDTVEYIATQPWCDGNIGVYGASYIGFTAWMAALAKPPHLKTLVAEITSPDAYGDWMFQDGAFRLGFIFSWLALFFIPDEVLRAQNPKPYDIAGIADSLYEFFLKLPLNKIDIFKDYAPYYYEWIKNPKRNFYWDKIFNGSFLEGIHIPILHIAGWYDLFLNGGIEHFKKLEKAGLNYNKIIIGPWCHEVPLPNLVGEIDFGFKSSQDGIDRDGILIRWFDRWLKNIPNEIDKEDKVNLFVMGRNNWRKEKVWPLENVKLKPYYLYSKNRANSLRGDGLLLETPDFVNSSEKDTIFHDPNNPVNSLGGNLCCYPPVLKLGAYDRSSIEQREDVLIYTSMPLIESLEITGYPKAELWVKANAESCDFNATLVDVFIDDKSINVCDGVIRYDRTSESNHLNQRPGSIMDTVGPEEVGLYLNEIAKIEINLWPTSYVFRKGHRIRVEISASNFPKFDRNLGGFNNFESLIPDIPIIQSVLHSEIFSSKINLPVIIRKSV